RGLAGLAQRDRRHAGKVGTRQDRQHPGLRERARPADLADARVRVRAPHDRGVRQSGPDQIVDVAAGAHEQARVLQPPDRAPDDPHGSVEWYHPLVKWERTVTVIGCHVGGEDNHVIVGGVLPPPGATMFEKKRYLETQADELRRWLLLEPRGKPALCVNL